MSATAAAVPIEKQKKKVGKLKLVLIIVVVLAAIGAAGWFSGVIPGLLHGRAHDTAEVPASGESASAATAPVFVDMPDIVANMNNGGRRASFIKLRAKLELAKKEDVATVQAAMPRVLDMFQGYLREVRPEELRGSAGTYRLREELLGRVNIAAAPARVLDVLFAELLVQ